MNTPSRYAWTGKVAEKACAEVTPEASPASVVSPSSSMPPTFTLPRVLVDRLPPALTHTLHQRMNGAVEEIRLRAGRYVCLTMHGENVITDLMLDATALSDILTSLCGGSLYAYSQDIANGFLTLPDGIRVGVVGRAVCEDGKVIGIRDVTSLCIRLPHLFRSVGSSLARMIRDRLESGSTPGGILLYSPPGVGKTTLLRNISISLAAPPRPLRTVLIDTRHELCFGTELPGLSLDVLSGYPRALGVEIATRTLNPQVMVCDEIGDCTEAMALIAAHHGGVPLVASAHASTVEELLHRTGLRLLHEARLFSSYIGLRRMAGDAAGEGFLYDVTSWEAAEQQLTSSHTREASS